MSPESDFPDSDPLLIFAPNSTVQTYLQSLQVPAGKCGTVLKNRIPYALLLPKSTVFSFN